MSGKRKALLLILTNSAVAILLMGLVLCVFWTRLHGPNTLWFFMAIMMAIFVGYMFIIFIILRANGQRIRNEQASVDR